MSKMNGKDLNDDFVGKGFHRLDDKILAVHPPKIKWGQQYRDWPIERRLAYAEKLAATMNHAAALVQDERDQLNVLCEKKERQIEAMKVAIDQNNEMLQQQITKMNAERQQYNDAAAAMMAELKVLRNGDHY